MSEKWFNEQVYAEDDFGNTIPSGQWEIFVDDSCNALVSTTPKETSHWEVLDREKVKARVDLMTAAPEVAAERDRLLEENAKLKERISILIDAVIREDELTLAARKVVLESIAKQKQKAALLEALELLRDFECHEFQDEQEGIRVYKIVEAAIAEAKGETQ